jgi:hypothetical protein
MFKALENIHSLIATIIAIGGSALFGIAIYYLFIKVLGSFSNKSKGILFKSLIN